ncbi:MAG TPA: phosphoribulokinase [Denitromonas sp.]|uniref:phosphoribulokinase n=1 Tax=Denitromonas sp. TaxID=2734609 RepID=UPI001D5A7A98|nr:phosphoribulokinase [Rhodocyclaceae bacterium]MCP5221454.1 phosphoribulokinase [Zoogloeaceae bacterium]HQU88847.1 phosphoribulokinase [Denitromonas sp.]HQV13570.1 phosphoribulokinase [Denitromonas sp.]
MSMKHPIIAVTGSSGAGTTTVKHTFEAIFHRENVNAAIIEGDSFHRHTRDEMKRLIDEAEARGERGISHFGPEANLITDLEQIFRAYGDSATGRRRHYVHNEAQSLRWNLPMGTFTEWEDLPVGTDCLFYEGLHGAMVTEEVNIARHVDLLIGVVPTINLEWIQKLHRDTRLRGYSKDAVQDTILRRMHDYVHYIVPQFSHTHINFQRVPVVDTSNPFSSRDIPTLEESMVVIRFKDPRGVDFPYLLNMISGSFMSRANTIVVSGGRLDLAMQLVLTPLIWKLMERRRQWV